MFLFLRRIFMELVLGMQRCVPTPYRTESLKHGVCLGQATLGANAWQNRKLEAWQLSMKIVFERSLFVTREHGASVSHRGDSRGDSD